MISGEHQRVDVAAAQDETHLAAAEPLGLAQQRGEARRARALDHRLLDLEQHHDGLLDVALVHEEHVRHEARDDLLRDPAGLLHRDALGDGGGAEGGRRAAQRVIHRREAHRLHADDLDRGLEGLRRRGDAGDEAAAAHRDEQEVQLRVLAQHLEGDGALARR